MKLLPSFVETGYLRLFDPVSRRLADRNVNPNSITIVGTLFWIAGGALYGIGAIHLAGWLLGVTAFFDVVDGQVARLTGRSTEFGAFLDSTLDRISDGAVLGGLAFFYATSSSHSSAIMLVVCLATIIGTFLVSYTRAKADAIGIDAHIGFMQRPERVVLMSAPQAFFGLALNGLVLAGIIMFLGVTAWMTVFQRMRVVYQSRVEQRPAVVGRRAS